MRIRVGWTKKIICLNETRKRVFVKDISDY
jgi:hypothetical protein